MRVVATRERVSRLSVMVVAGVALAATPAAGGTPRLVPGVRQARYMATVVGSETTDWSEPEHTTGVPNCYHRLTKTGEGHEKISFRSSLPDKVLVYSLGRGAYSIEYGTWVMFGRGASGIRASGSIERSGAIRYHDYAGLCNTGGGPPSDTGPYDCGTIAKQWRMSLLPNGSRRLDWGLGEERATGAKATFHNCPLEYPDGVAQETVTTSPISFRVATLLRRGVHRIVVHGHKAPKQIRITEFGGTSTSTTTIDVKFVLTRVR